MSEKKSHQMKKSKVSELVIEKGKGKGKYLVLAEKRQVEENLQRLSVGGHDNELRDTAVQGLGGCRHTNEMS